MSDKDREKEKALKKLTEKALKKFTAKELQKEVYNTKQLKKENKTGK